MKQPIHHPFAIRRAISKPDCGGALVALAIAGCGSSVGAEEQGAGTVACPPDFATAVVHVEYGVGAGAGQDRMPDIVLGPPHGAGSERGSTDVLTLGVGGQIVLDVGGNGVQDRPGPDFVVFENAFYVGGDPSKVYVEPAEVSVSEDGTGWTAFPCSPGDSSSQECAGMRPVFSNPDNQISPFDPSVAGGDAFDLARVGIPHAKYIRIVDRSTDGGVTANGFDLDAVAIVHRSCP